VRRLLIGGAVGLVVVLLAGCGGSDTKSVESLQHQADLWSIDQIEKDFHKATTLKDLDLMVGLWAPNATMTIGSGQTATGTDEIRRYWLEKSVAFEATNYWISDHPAYKVEITVNGDRGTLHFECHYVDAVTEEMALVTVADLDVARIDGEWLITNMVAGSTALAR
jgi:ketosteroid isomerase-like protein